MALRSRSRTPNATSGPGRGPHSDGRVRPRRSPGRRRVGQRHASAEDLRRRAEVLFTERAGGADAGTAAAADVDLALAVDVGEVPVGDAPEVRARPPGTWQERAGMALRERLPVWVQARCGMERRSVLALTAVLVAAAAFALQHFWAGRAQPVRPPEVVRAAAPYEVGERSPAAGAAPSAAAGTSATLAASSATMGAAGTAGAEIVVDVSGKVRKPGIHRLPAGSRVVDALNAAGGVRPGTNTDGLNRARFLVDGEQVVVGGPAPATAAGAGGAGTGAGAGAAGSAGAGMGAGPAAPVSLNTATVDQLDTLPGVGPVLAQHIVDYRTRHGGFRSVNELREVNGIGERRFADLRNLVRP
ncbi:ComEA family DNA-binding protein [Streptomyces sp. NBC_01275]|uniref:ComEA family DNA-binding protein n=1 Tax=Streptomyces sp. NBC_01275 TaxID=2903807 RepID=UPI00225A859B|nr:ComEA family DNA-binding protein [Streptomyces sp. NBC_01275]MCX4762093.1 ComEA family DNA-binding protein [Streptomyces sp. NBC_01275]